MKTNIKFLSENQVVHGVFFSASGNASSFPTILLLHGFPGNEEDVLGLGQEFSQHGFNTLSFNYRGTFQSEGRYSFHHTQLDIAAAYDYLLEAETSYALKVDTRHLILGGYSFGGGMALIYAANHPEIRYLFLIAGTDHGEFAREYQRNPGFSAMIDETLESLKAPHGPVTFPGKAVIADELLPRQSDYDFLSRANQILTRRILLIGGWEDSNVVLEKHVLPLFRTLQAAGAPNLNIHAFEDGHGFEKVRKELAEVILTWMKALFTDKSED